MLKRELVADDSAMPKDVFSAGDRSVNAIRHFWPNGVQLRGWASSHVGKALHATVEKERIVVDGAHWSVEWATDAYDKRRAEFLARIKNGQALNDEFIAWAEEREAAMECDLTIVKFK